MASAVNPAPRPLLLAESARGAISPVSRSPSHSGSGNNTTTAPATPRDRQAAVARSPIRHSIIPGLPSPPPRGATDIFSLTDALLAQKYMFIRECGFGNWGSVWQVFLRQPQPPPADRESDAVQHTLAVKLVHRSKSPTTAARVRSLWTEFKILRTLKRDQHPNLIRFYDFVISPTYALVSMEYHASLLNVKLPESHARKHIFELLSAVEHLHAHGITHNDIKPTNLLLSDDGRAVLCDFGFAQLYGPTSPTPFLSTSSWGTPEYLSPERAKNQPHDDRLSDIFALGVTSYEIVVGRTPFEKDEKEEFLDKEALEVYYQRTLTGEFFGPIKISEEFRGIIRTMIEPQASLRIKSCLKVMDIAFFDSMRPLCRKASSPVCKTQTRMATFDTPPNGKTRSRNKVTGKDSLDSISKSANRIPLKDLNNNDSVPVALTTPSKRTDNKSPNTLKVYQDSDRKTPDTDRFMASRKVSSPKINPNRFSVHSNTYPSAAKGRENKENSPIAHKTGKSQIPVRSKSRPRPVSIVDEVNNHTVFKNDKPTLTQSQSLRKSNARGAEKPPNSLLIPETAKGIRRSSFYYNKDSDIFANDDKRQNAATTPNSDCETPMFQVAKVAGKADSPPTLVNTPNRSSKSPKSMNRTKGIQKFKSRDSLALSPKPQNNDKEYKKSPQKMNKSSKLFQGEEAESGSKETEKSRLFESMKDFVGDARATIRRRKTLTGDSSDGHSNRKRSDVTHNAQDCPGEFLQAQDSTADAQEKIVSSETLAEYSAQLTEEYARSSPTVSRRSSINRSGICVMSRKSNNDHTTLENPANGSRKAVGSTRIRSSMTPSFIEGNGEEVTSKSLKYLCENDKTTPKEALHGEKEIKDPNEDDLAGPVNSLDEKEEEIFVESRKSSCSLHEKPLLDKVENESAFENHDIQSEGEHVRNASNDSDLGNMDHQSKTSKSSRKTGKPDTGFACPVSPSPATPTSATKPTESTPIASKRSASPRTRFADPISAVKTTPQSNTEVLPSVTVTGKNTRTLRKTQSRYFEHDVGSKVPTSVFDAPWQRSQTSLGFLERPSSAFVSERVDVLNSNGRPSTETKTTEIFRPSSRVGYLRNKFSSLSLSRKSESSTTRSKTPEPLSGSRSSISRQFTTSPGPSLHSILVRPSQDAVTDTNRLAPDRTLNDFFDRINSPPPKSAKPKQPLRSVKTFLKKAFPNSRA